MKNIALGNETHRDLKIFAAERGLTMSASVKLLLAGWNKHFPVSNLDASRSDVAENATSTTGESTENHYLPTDGAAGRTIGHPDAPAAPDEQRNNHYVLA